jgi:hypothetical protein
MPGFLTNVVLNPADGRSAVETLHTALDNLKELFLSIGEAYERDFKAGNFERYEEPQLDLEQLKIDAEEGKRRRNQEKRAKAEAMAAAAAARA